MDHAFWPFVTTKLYIDQTGDTDVLFERIVPVCTVQLHLVVLPHIIESAQILDQNML